MARIEVAGLGIEYELLGKAGAPAVAITPGGRFSKESRGVRELGEALAAGGKRVLLWDRPNCGASDICFDAAGESRLQAEVLTSLLRTLELGPTALVAGSAGSRVSLIAAVHDPEAVSHLIPWWISGGIIGLMMIGSFYCCNSAAAASSGGMAAVAQLPIWQEQLALNPKNREIMLKQDPAQFIKTMERWATGFLPPANSPVPGVTPRDFAALKMPVLIFRGCPTDIYHPEWITDWVHKLIPHSEYVNPPWQGDIFAQRMAEGNGLFIDWPDLAPAILEFTRRG